MAGNKVNTKGKGKDDRGKGSKASSPQDEDEVDFTMLRKPVVNSITGIAQAIRIYEQGTQEIKDLLSNECDLLYECKVCRNIFRSLVNFISHKRIYCKDKFNPSSHGHFIAPMNLASELKKIQRMEESYQESQKEDRSENSDEDNRIPLTKDITSVMENIAKAKGRDPGDTVRQVKLQGIDSSTVAVFQNMIYDGEEDSSNSMRSQVKEINKIMSQDKAVLQTDGSFTVESGEGDDGYEEEGVIQISDDDESGDRKLVCKTCNLQFATQKTLKFHMKYKHLETRLVYPCPDCLEIFSTSWSVYRHLFKVHRKTAAQIRRLRESIQAKAFKMNNPPAFYERRKNNVKNSQPAPLTEEERLDQENQAWLDNMEQAGCGARCGGCGRSFERRAALQAHVHTCPLRRPPERERHDRNDRSERPTDKKIQIHIRRDYNKEPNVATAVKSEQVTEPKPTETESQPKKPERPPLEEATMFIDDDSNDKSSQSASPSPDKEPQTMQTMKMDKHKKMLFSVQTERLGHNLKALKYKMTNTNDVDIEHYTCKRCNVKSTNLRELCEHMAVHYKWVRYACKLCNMKDYYIEKLTEHVKNVHKLNGDDDFYFSTFKAVDGNEALEISEAMTSRGPSRRSSDSSRISEDSVDADFGGRKRKSQMNKQASKRKREAEIAEDTEDSKDGEFTMDKVIQVIFGNEDKSRSPEEQSSEVDEVEIVKPEKKTTPVTILPSRRPVRNRAKRKNEDFEYDLSNLLKMEAQGYRESQNPTPPKAVTRKRSQPDTSSTSSNDVIYMKENKGALLAMTKKSIETSSAHIRPYNMSLFEVKEKPRFIRPGMQVKPKVEKSPKKIDDDKVEEKTPEKQNAQKDAVTPERKDSQASDKKDESMDKKDESQNKNDESIDKKDVVNDKKDEGKDKKETAKTVVPIKLRHGLEVMKNPIVNKSLAELTKAGMKTKILVIKPINRAKDGSSLKFQTIKLKDPKSSLEKKPEVMVVKMPVVNMAKDNEMKDKVIEDISEEKKNSEDCNGTEVSEVASEESKMVVD